MPHFFLKLVYLFKHQANREIFYKFIVFQIFKPFLNYKRSKKKNIFKTYVSNKRITHNFFSTNAYDWLRIIDGKIKYYLEIGAFEGLSLLFVDQNFKPIKIHAVDTWKGSNEHGSETTFSKVWKNYLHNTNQLKNLENFKMSSDTFFEKKRQKYDLIYIDGLHKRKQVEKDLLNSLKLCHEQTIIIMDDFFWKFDQKFTEDLPISAIVPIIKKFKIKVIGVTNNQIFLKHGSK